MAIDTVYLGQTFQASTIFYNDGIDPPNATNPAQYTIRDFNGNKITSGIGSQNLQNPFQWQAGVSIPENAPSSGADKYSITWTLRTDEGQQTTTEYFSVRPEQQFDLTELDTVYMAGTTVSDTLAVGSSDNVSNIKVNVLDSSGNLITYQSDGFTTSYQGGQKVISLGLTDSALLSASLKPYMLAWQYNLNGYTKTEYHFAYVVGPKTVFYMEQLRNFIDKLRFNHPNPRLRFNDVDLISYLVQGVQIINGTKPTVTQFTLETVPAQFEWYLTNAAAWVGLSAQYLAEGEQSFDFSGQTISLNVDRTQYYDAALGRIQSVLETDLVSAKTMYAKTTARPVLGLSPSPCINGRFAALYLYGGRTDADFLLLGNRANGYINSIQNFLQ